jgi:predicted ATPase
LSFPHEFGGVELGDLNLFIGANGSGKSNLLDAAKFLQEAQRNVRGFLSTSQVKDWQWERSSADDQAVVEVELALQGLSARYWLGFSASSTGDVEFGAEGLGDPDDQAERSLFVRSETTTVDFLVKRPGGYRAVEKEQLDADQTVLTGLRHPSDESSLKLVRQALNSWAFFGEWGFGRRSNRLKTTQASATVQGLLLDDGSNAPSRLNTLLQRRGFRERLLAHLQLVLPDVEDVLADFNMGAAQIVFLESTRGRRTPASRLSDGTLHWLMLGLILLDDEVSSPVFLEEPELGLHPDAILGLARLLKEASARRQVVVTTHAPLLLSAFTDDPECVYAFDRDDRGTRVERLTRKRLVSWTRDGRSLADVWAAGAIGANRW